MLYFVNNDWEIMAEDELAAFRKRWKEELKSKRVVGAPSPSFDVPARSGQRELKNRYFEDSKQNPNEACSLLKPTQSCCDDDEGRAGGRRGKAVTDCEDQPEYVSIAHGLLDGRTSPLLDRIQKERIRRKRQHLNTTSECSTVLQQNPHRKVQKEEKLLDQFIQDLVGSWWWERWCWWWLNGVYKGTLNSVSCRMRSMTFPSLMLSCRTS